MEGTKRRQPLPFCDENTPLSDDLQKAVLLPTAFHERIGRPPSLHPPKDLQDSIHTSISTRAIPDLAQPFTTEKLTHTFSSLKPGKSAGPDAVSYEFLLQLPLPIQGATLNIYNTSWLLGTYPDKWKCSTLLLIPKPGKDLTLPSAYCPIALLSCTGKLLERLVYNCLT